MTHRLDINLLYISCHKILYHTNCFFRCAFRSVLASYYIYVRVCGREVGYLSYTFFLNDGSQIELRGKGLLVRPRGPRKKIHVRRCLGGEGGIWKASGKVGRRRGGGGGLVSFFSLANFSRERDEKGKWPAFAFLFFYSVCGRNCVLLFHSTLGQASSAVCLLRRKTVGRSSISYLPS